MKSPIKILWIAGGRSVSGRDPGRKISSILGCWKRMGYDVRAVFGADFPGGAGGGAEDFRKQPVLREMVSPSGAFKAISPLLFRTP